MYTNIANFIIFFSNDFRCFLAIKEYINLSVTRYIDFTVTYTEPTSQIYIDRGNTISNTPYTIHNNYYDFLDVHLVNYIHFKVKKQNKLYFLTFLIPL